MFFKFLFRQFLYCNFRLLNEQTNSVKTEHTPTNRRKCYETSLYLRVPNGNGNILTISRTRRCRNLLPCHTGIYKPNFNVIEQGDGVNSEIIRRKHNYTPPETKNVDKRIKTEQLQFWLSLGTIGFFMYWQRPFFQIGTHVCLCANFDFPATNR